MITEPTDRCPAAPDGESHRWRIPDQGTTGPAICKWCQAERVFPVHTDASHWETAGERRGHGHELLGRTPPTRVW